MRFIYLLILISMSAFSQMSDDPRSWTVVTDQVMGGKSELEANYDEGTFQLKGYVTTENNGGFVRLAHRPDSIDKNTKGIKFMAKGNDETYEIHVTMKGIKLPPWAYHSQSFDVGSEWKEYYIEFKDFKKNAFMSPSLKPKNIRDISIAGFGRDFDVDLTIKDIALF